MNSQQKVSQIFNTFYHLLKDLKPFIDTHDLKLAFDRDGNAYLLGSDFQERLNANSTLPREVRQEMRDTIAKHVPRLPLERESQ